MMFLVTMTFTMRMPARFTLEAFNVTRAEEIAIEWAEKRDIPYQTITVESVG